MVDYEGLPNSFRGFSYFVQDASLVYPTLLDLDVSQRVHVAI